MLENKKSSKSYKVMRVVLHKYIKSLDCFGSFIYTQNYTLKKLHVQGVPKIRVQRIATCS